MKPLHPITEEWSRAKPSEIAGIRASIAANGLRVPVKTWKGWIVDGRHRAEICEELGIVIIEEDLGDITEAEMRKVVEDANKNRRADTAMKNAEKQAAADAAIAADATRSDRQIGRAIGVDHKVIGRARRRVGLSPTRRQGTGKSKKKSKRMLKAESTNTPGAPHGGKREVIRAALRANPMRIDDDIAKEIGTTQSYVNRVRSDMIARRELTANAAAVARSPFAKPVNLDLPKANSLYRVIVVNHAPDEIDDERLLALDVGSIAANDGCALWLWFNNLPLALRAVTAWGFEPCSVFVWLRRFATSSRKSGKCETEQCLLAMRGAAAMWWPNAGPGIAFTGKINNHMDRPLEFQFLVENRTATSGHIADVFGRGIPRVNWDRE